MKRVWVLCMLCLMGIGFAGCDMPTTPQTSSQSEADKQEVLDKEALNQVGFPGISHFREKKMFKMIMEMRDKATATYTYLYSPMTGKLVFFCNSVGFPIPNSTQFTNPMRIATEQETNYRDDVALPQADPNGLYSPAESGGTWIMCTAPSGDLMPVYSEPDLLTTPYPVPDVSTQK